jgi:hypothetical protein
MRLSPEENCLTRPAACSLNVRFGFRLCKNADYLSARRQSTFSDRSLRRFLEVGNGKGPPEHADRALLHGLGRKRLLETP